MLAIVGLVAAGVSRQIAENAEAQKVQNTAARMRQVTEAMRAYMSARQAELAAAAPVGGVSMQVSATGGACAGALPSLQACGYLPSNFVNENPYGQAHVLYVRQPSAGVLEGFVATSGGYAIPAARLPRTASLVGPEGGFAATPDVPGCPSGAACGSYGGWQIADAASVVPAAAPGRLVAAMAFANGEVLQDYLYRVSVPGHPEANQMFTDLHMDGGGVRHDVDGVATLTADEGIFADDVTVGRDLAVGRDVTVAGNASANEFLLPAMGDQAVSEAVYKAGVYATCDSPSKAACSAQSAFVAKPACPAAKTAQVFVAPVVVSENQTATASAMSAFQAYAEAASDGTGWLMRLRVRTENGWSLTNSTYGRVMALVKCS